MKKQDNKIIASDIDASLSYGQIFLSQAWIVMLIFILVCTVLFCIGYICYIVTSVIENNIDMILVIIPGIVFIGFVVLCTFLFLRMSKEKHKATLWLEDAIVLEAYAKSVGQTLHVRNMIARTATAIEVSFEYDDKRCVRQSTYTDKPLYLAVYTKYADKKILIAYSPKYDEVMLIKPESAKRYKENNNM